MKGVVYIGLIAAGAAIGAISTGLLNRETANASGARSYSGAAIVGQDGDVQRLRAQYSQQIEQLISEKDELQKRLSETEASKAGQLTRSEERERTTESVQRIEADKKKRAVAMLLAAGYSPDQIMWFRTRLEELQKQRIVAEAERRARGLPSDPVKQMAYLYDQDIELRYEIGDDEYERYLRALGRPTNIHVTEVLPGSIADSAGIKAGDIVLDYDNTRLFNLGELNGLSMGKNGKFVTVTVSRGGEIVKLSVPGGPMGVKSRRPSIDSSVAIRP